MSVAKIKMVFPYGTLASRKWLLRQGVEEYTIKNYLRSGKIATIQAGIYYWSEFPIKWQGVVASLKMLTDTNVFVGGLTALQFQGFAHYLKMGPVEDITLYSYGSISQRLKSVFEKLDFISVNCHSSGNLWHQNMPVDTGLKKWKDPGWDQEFLISTPERAILEILHILPMNISFDHVDELMQGLTQLSPKRLNELLSYCKSIKVKRLFFWYSERYEYAWTRHLNSKEFDLGTGKRSIATNGVLDKKYSITVPKGLTKERTNG